MTIHIPLQTPEAGPSCTPNHLAASSYIEQDLRDVIRTLRGSKKIVVVTGAGISTGANIPDFRSSTGLFNDNDAGYAGKDLFHVKCLSSPKLLSAHHALMTSLASLAISANPTPFHQYLASLSTSNQLLRCYTQNIDDLESKVGLRVGIPLPPKKKSRSSSKKTKNQDDQNVESILLSQNGLLNPLSNDNESLKANIMEDIDPEVIPLHGIISTLNCILCQNGYPIIDYLPLPIEGTIPCPKCELNSSIREALFERRRKTGTLRVNVILYGEEHSKGELIGKLVEKDIKDSAVDCLLIVGTSLSVPGIKRIVKEMSKSINHHSNHSNLKGKRKILQKNSDNHDNITKGKKIILINNEFPKPHKEWIGFIDYWIQCDIQQFTLDYLLNDNYSTKGKDTNKTQGEEGSGLPITPKKKILSTDTKTIFPPTPESLDRSRIDSTRSKSFDLNDDVREEDDRNVAETPISGKRRREVEVVIPSPISLKKRKCIRKDDIRDRQGTPTPIPQ
ncbi:uncharacterized protein L201_005778 [Kwoniella dendrophila CBS 6074]|uniref:Deacetylase sirtuin-type domain-containing protein n=1 Tax=Kwoniella dendrophila CBS 6074 TaxID=1295534 RepID=A0AAX4JZG7_9TREE